LLNKARANNHQRKRKRSTSSSNKHEEEISNTNHSINGPNNSNNRNLDVFTATSSTTFERMLPTSFGTNLGNQPSIGIRTNTAMPIIKKDPSMAMWEQHTKGMAIEGSFLIMGIAVLDPNCLLKWDGRDLVG
jgi:hypothetical protein